MYDAEFHVSRTVTKLLFEKILYAHVAIQCRKIFTDKIPTAAVGITDHVNLIVNPKFWEKLNDNEKLGVLEHEIIHLVLYHPTRMVKFSNKERYNIAIDLVVNQFISKDRLPNKGEGYCTLDNPLLVDKKGNKLPENMDADWYYYNLKDDVGVGKGIMLIDSHDEWGKIGHGNLPEDVKDAILKEILRRAFENCNKSYGNIPGELLRHLEGIFAPKVKKLPINQVMRRFVNRSIIGDITYTKKRLSKRYGTRPGIKISNKMKLLVGFDTSGSVDDYMLRDFVNQVQFLSKMGIELWITECDTQTYRLYKFNKSIDVMMGGGGTDMEPIIETGEKGVYDGIIVFTDGEFGQIERNAPRMPVLWVVANRDVDHKIPVNWGEIVHMPILEKSYE